VIAVLDLSIIGADGSASDGIAAMPSWLIYEVTKSAERYELLRMAVLATGWSFTAQVGTGS
jgi:hypothetical protein